MISQQHLSSKNAAKKGSAKNEHGFFLKITKMKAKTRDIRTDGTEKGKKKGGPGGTKKAGPTKAQKKVGGEYLLYEEDESGDAGDVSHPHTHALHTSRNRVRVSSNYEHCVLRS